MPMIRISLSGLETETDSVASKTSVSSVSPGVLFRVDRGSPRKIDRKRIQNALIFLSRDCLWQVRTGKYCVSCSCGQFFPLVDSWHEDARERVHLARPFPTPCHMRDLQKHLFIFFLSNFYCQHLVCKQTKPWDLSSVISPSLYLSQHCVRGRPEPTWIEIEFF